MIENMHIEFSVDVDLSLFFLDFCQKYGRYRSSFFPIFLVWGGSFPPNQYRFVEANADPKQDAKEIAQMSTKVLDGEIMVIVEGIQEERFKWYSVVQAIMEDLWNAGYRFRDVIPHGIVHHMKIEVMRNEIAGIFIEGKQITDEGSKLPGSKKIVPSIAKFLKRWKEAYTVIEETNDILLNQYYEGQTEITKVSIDEYRDALNDKMHWKPSYKTIERINKAGKAGLLE